MNTSEMTDILDVAGNIHSPWPDRLLVLLGVALLLILAGVIWSGYRFWQKRARQQTRLSPVEQALLELKPLQDGQAQKPDLLYWHLTEVFKRYVTDGLGCDLDDKTREEIRRLAQGFEPYCRDEKQWREILTFLDRSEQIKFAKETSPSEQVKSDVTLVEDFVRYSSQKKAGESKSM